MEYKNKLNEENKIETYLNALAHDNIEILELIKKGGLKFPVDIIQLAIQKKVINVIKYLIEKCKYKFNKYCFEEAVQLADINMLEFLLANNCEWGEISDCTANNIKYNAKIYDWLKEKKCPWNLD